MRKLWHREVQELALGHTARKRWAGLEPEGLEARQRELSGGCPCNSGGKRAKGACWRGGVGLEKD